MARIKDPERQRDERGKGQDPALEGGKKSVGYRVAIISFRRRRVDEHDNLKTGAKPLCDRITESLGFASDDNPLLQWEYHQVITTGRQGTLVKIDVL